MPICQPMQPHGLRLLVAAIAVLCPGAPTPAVPAALATRSAPFLEDALAPRTVATLCAEVLPAADGAVRLQLTVRAYGDAVLPLPGLEGAHGANLRTAEELERLLRDGALRLVLRRSGENLPGRVVAVERGALPARAVRTDGSIDFDALTGECAIGATFVGPPFTTSPTWCYLLADDAPRVAVGLERIDGAWHITTLQSLAAPAAAAAGAR